MQRKILIIILIVLMVISLTVSIYIIGKTIASTTKNEPNTNNNTITPISSYNNPIIPNGFKKVETEEASWELVDGIPVGWNNGLVIEDELGNQFVWVPLKTRSFKAKNILRELNCLYDEEQERERNQIDNYGGFYIARYEAGFPDETQVNNISSLTNDIVGVPVSKQGRIPWDYISLKNAKKSAKKMYQNEDLESDLVTTREWLHLMEWLAECGYDIDNPKSFGNFSNVNFRFKGYYSTDFGKNYTYGENNLKAQYNMILSTGATERNKTNNIYDLAGNVMEYTDGWVKERGYYSIGGHYDTTSDYQIYFANLLGVEPLGKLGFRVVLYNK